MRRLNLKADPLGASVPKNPIIAVIGAGKDALLWMGNERGFLGVARNCPETRRFLRRALQRLEKGLSK
jgi:hypothetical protein